MLTHRRWFRYWGISRGACQDLRNMKAAGFTCKNNPLYMKMVINTLIYWNGESGQICDKFSGRLSVRSRCRPAQMLITYKPPYRWILWVKTHIERFFYFISDDWLSVSLWKKSRFDLWPPERGSSPPLPPRLLIVHTWVCKPALKAASFFFFLWWRAEVFLHRSFPLRLI